MAGGVEMQIRNVYLSNFRHTLPSRRVPQEEGLAWVQNHRDRILMKQGLETQTLSTLSKMFKHVAAKPKQIAYRYSDLPDLASEGIGQAMPILQQQPHFQQSSPLVPLSLLEADLDARMEYYTSVANQKTRELYAGDDLQPDHIIHVTCTGYVAPSAVQQLILEKNWQGEIGVSHAYHMGCYAAFPTVRLARALVLADHLKVDIVHTEFCSLHFDFRRIDPQQFVIESLFADGYIKYSVTDQQPLRGLRLIDTSEHLISDSSQLMTWRPGSQAFAMTLDRRIPDMIKGRIKALVDKFIEGHRHEMGQEDPLFIIHPGGPKIIDQLAEVLQLQEPQIAASRQVLSARGNMSSATVPHIWQAVLDDNSMPPGRSIVSMAFGPGLTVFLSLSQIV